MLAAALERTDGDDAAASSGYAQERLFDPPGIDTTHAFSGRLTGDDHAAFDRAGFGWGTDAPR